MKIVRYLIVFCISFLPLLVLRGGREKIGHCYRLVYEGIHSMWKKTFSTKFY